MRSRAGSFGGSKGADETVIACREQIVAALVVVENSCASRLGSFDLVGREIIHCLWLRNGSILGHFVLLVEVAESGVVKLPRGDELVQVLGGFVDINFGISAVSVSLLLVSKQTSAVLQSVGGELGNDLEELRATLVGVTRNGNLVVGGWEV